MEYRISNTSPNEHVQRWDFDSDLQALISHTVGNDMTLPGTARFDIDSLWGDAAGHGGGFRKSASGGHLLRVIYRQLEISTTTQGYVGGFTFIMDPDLST